MNTRFLWLKNALAKILGFLGFKSKLDNQAQESNNDLFKDLLDKSKPLRMIKKEEFSDELISQVAARNIKLWVDNASEDLNRALGLKNAKITMRGDAIQHIFKRHGVNSELAKEGQPPIINQDLRDYSSIVNNADIHGIGRGKRGEKALVSGKQINGYHIIVETISTKHNELMLKTMYKENGLLKDSKAIKEADGLLSSKNRAVNSPDLKNGVNLDSPSPSASQNSTTNQPKNQEKPSKLDEAVEELEKARKIAKANEALEILEKTKAELIPAKINIDEFLNALDEIKNKKNFLEHILEKKDASQRLAYLNLIEPTLKSPNIKITKTENRILKEKRFKKFTDGKDFFYLLVTKENGNLILTGFKTNKLNTIKKELADFDSLEYGTDIIHTFIQQGSKQDTQGVGYQVPNSTTNQPKNQEKPSKLDEAVEELEKAKEENLKERNLSESQNLTQVNPNDSSAMDELRRESQEKAEQKEIQQQNDDDTIRRQK